MIRINFHRTLQKYTDVSYYDIDVSTYSQVNCFLFQMFPKLKNYINKINNSENRNEILTMSYDKKHLVPESWILRDSIKEHISELWILPTVSGGGGRGAQILIGVALIAAAFVTAGAAAPAGAGILAGFNVGLAGFAAKAALGVGINILLAGLFQQNLERPSGFKPTTDSSQRRNNDLFDGLQNTTDTSQSVPLQYGLMRVSGQFISGFVKTIDHGKNDFIRVREQF